MAFRLAAAAASPDQRRDIHPGELMHFLLPSAISGGRTLLSAPLILTFPVTGALGIDALARQAIQHEDMHFHFFLLPLSSRALPSSSSSLKCETSLASPAAQGLALLCMPRVDERPGRAQAWKADKGSRRSTSSPNSLFTGCQSHAGQREGLSFCQHWLTVV